ncbi:MAG: hypothetical protein EPN82_01380 [Bacteroidetes bacterium]|nr:MAG: hypothetical protein EPN82_01380 [Bacteroidota bacterium]
MKKFFLLTCILLLSATILKAQFSFSVGSNFLTGGASFGYKIGDLVPYIGIQYISGGVTSTESGYRTIWPDTSLIPYSDKFEESISIYMPNAGLKYFIISNKDLKLFLNGSFNIGFVSSTDKRNGVEDTTNNYLSDLSIWGFEIGIGSEYFLSKNFSVGGMLSLRQLFVGSKYSDNYPPPTSYEESINVGLLNSQFTFNYYFGE